MTDQYPVIVVAEDAGETIEQMGTKPKFWFRDASLGRCLYKEARPGTGEDWAEKVAAELAALLDLPHAGVELGSWKETRGIVSPSFVPAEGALIHGNEILHVLVPEYPETASRRVYRVPQHTVNTVVSILESGTLAPPIGWQIPSSIRGAVDVFVGYLMLDAWICNTDRHHENWGWVAIWHSESRISYHLAPTYDHASSLGRNELDANRQRRLTTKDPGFSVVGYVERARSALYRNEQAAKPLSTMEAFEEAARLLPHAARYWLECLAHVETTRCRETLSRVPRDRITETAVEFAFQMLIINQAKLLRLAEEIA